MDACRPHKRPARLVTLHVTDALAVTPSPAMIIVVGLGAAGGLRCCRSWSGRTSLAGRSSRSLWSSRSGRAHRSRRSWRFWRSTGSRFALLTSRSGWTNRSKLTPFHPQDLERRLHRARLEVQPVQLAQEDRSLRAGLLALLRRDHQPVLLHLEVQDQPDEHRQAGPEAPRALLVRAGPADRERPGDQRAQADRLVQEDQGDPVVPAWVRSRKTSGALVRLRWPMNQTHGKPSPKRGSFLKDDADGWNIPTRSQFRPVRPQGAPANEPHWWGANGRRGA